MSPVQISVPSLDELEHLRATVTATDSDEVLVDFQNKVDAALPALLKIARAATKLKAARYERHKRVRHLQALATEARRTGKPGVVNEQPNVFDIGDVTDEICEALEELDR